MKNTKQLVHDKIVELVPELKELSEGCEVIWLGQIFRIFHVEYGCAWAYGGKEIISPALSMINAEEIIGHPIQFQDVLRATGCPLTPKGKLNYRTEELLRKYDLTRDHDNQSDEYYEWLASVLQINK